VGAALAGCGGDEERGIVTPAPGDTPPPAPTAPPSATATATPTPTRTPDPTPHADEGGDEAEARVPIQLRVAQGGIFPPTVAVPAFLALELVVRNDNDVPVTVRLEGEAPLDVAPFTTGRQRLSGRRPGTYVIDAGAAGSVTLITGAEPGP
jgi:hypothetical protein